MRKRETECQNERNAYERVNGRDRKCSQTYKRQGVGEIQQGNGEKEAEGGEIGEKCKKEYTRKIAKKKSE